MHVYLCFTREEANIFKIGIVIEVLFHVQHWPLFGGLSFVKGQIGHLTQIQIGYTTSFLTLNFIIDLGLHGNI